MIFLHTYIEMIARIGLVNTSITSQNGIVVVVVAA